MKCGIRDSLIDGFIWLDQYLSSITAVVIGI